MKKYYNQPQMEVSELLGTVAICAGSAPSVQDGGNVTATFGTGDVISD